MQRAALALVLMAGCGAPAPQPGAGSCAASGSLCVLAGDGLNGFNEGLIEDLPAAESRLYYPTSVSFDPDDRLVIVDHNNMRIRRLEEDGILRTIAGSGEHNWSTVGADALDSPLENPIDVAFEPDGRFFILPLHEQRVIYVGTDGIIQEFAGTGEEGYAGDGGPALEALMSQGSGIALADDGTLYIADTENHAIRAVDSEGLITTAAGCGEAGFADGETASACLDSPQRLSWRDGALYIADLGNHAVRRLDPAADTLETLAGTGSPGFSGDGGPATAAQLSTPLGVDVAPDGTVYVADGGNHVVRRIDPEGIIDTVAGMPGVPGFQLSGGPALDTPLNFPGDVAVSPEGDLVIADMFNGAVQCLRGPIP